MYSLLDVMKGFRKKLNMQRVFYGYQSIDLENFNLDIIEMYGQKSNLFINRILKFVEKWLIN